MDSAGRSDEVLFKALESQFKANRCEAQHNGRICSSEVTHGFGTCEGARLLCLLGAGVKEAYLMHPEHLRCAACKRPIAECWRLVEL